MTSFCTKARLALKMEIIERIMQAQQARADEAAKAEAKKLTAIYEAEEEKKQTKEERMNFVRSQTEKVLKESGIADSLVRIDSELLEKTHKFHGIFYTYNPDGDYSFVELAWGNKSPIKKHDHYRVLVRVNPNTEAIAFLGPVSNEYTKAHWLRDGSVIEKSIVTAFLNPEPMDGSNRPIVKRRSS